MHVARIAHTCALSHIPVQSQLTTGYVIRKEVAAAGSLLESFQRLVVFDNAARIDIMELSLPYDEIAKPFLIVFKQEQLNDLTELQKVRCATCQRMRGFKNRIMPPSTSSLYEDELT